MFTKNWYKAIATQMAGAATVKPFTTQGYETSCGNVLNLLGNTSGPTMKQVVTSLDDNTHHGVVFGTGTTPPTIDDYTLSGDVIANISCSIAASCAVEGDSVVFTGIYTISNNNNTDITIGEVGIVTQTKTYDWAVMVERTVLDSPVTIPAGEIGKVTYTIRMNFPTA